MEHAFRTATGFYQGLYACIRRALRLLWMAQLRWVRHSPIAVLSSLSLAFVVSVAQLVLTIVPSLLVPGWLTKVSVGLWGIALTQTVASEARRRRLSNEKSRLVRLAVLTQSLRRSFTRELPTATDSQELEHALSNYVQEVLKALASFSQYHSIAATLLLESNESLLTAVSYPPEALHDWALREPLLPRPHNETAPGTSPATAVFLGGRPIYSPSTRLGRLLWVKGLGMRGLPLFAKTTPPKFETVHPHVELPETIPRGSLLVLPIAWPLGMNSFQAWGVLTLEAPEVEAFDVDTMTLASEIGTSLAESFRALQRRYSQLSS